MQFEKERQKLLNNPNNNNTIYPLDIEIETLQNDLFMDNLESLKLTMIIYQYVNHYQMKRFKSIQNQENEELFSEQEIRLGEIMKKLLKSLETDAWLEEMLHDKYNDEFLLKTRENTILFRNRIFNFERNYKQLIKTKGENHNTKPQEYPIKIHNFVLKLLRLVEEDFGVEIKVSYKDEEKFTDNNNEDIETGSELDLFENTTTTENTTTENITTIETASIIMNHENKKRKL